MVGVEKHNLSYWLMYTIKETNYDSSRYEYTMMKMGCNESDHAHGESLVLLLQSFGTMIATWVILNAF